MTRYYKIIYKDTGDTACYSNCNIDDKDAALDAINHDVVFLLGDEYAAEEISKEEYDRETDYIDGEDEL